MNSLRATVFVLIIVLILGGVFIYSKKIKLNTSSPIPPPASVVPPPAGGTVLPPPPEPSKEDSGYHSITLGAENVSAQFVEAVGKNHLAEVLSLNRLDMKHLQKNQLIIIPDSYDDLFALSSFPRVVPDLVNVPKIVLVSQKIQEFAVYENGNLIRFGAVSTGKKSTPSPSKLYHTNWKGKLVTSTVDDEWIMPWYFNLDNFDGVSMHQYDLPGYPASHSCVRLSEEDAKWFYGWADQWTLSGDKKTVLANGTPVLLFDEYDYNKIAPWKKLPEDKYAMRLTVEDISKVLEPELSKLMPNTSEQPLSQPQ
jgi:hypothetical protein